MMIDDTEEYNNTVGAKIYGTRVFGPREVPNHPSSNTH